MGLAELVRALEDDTAAEVSAVAAAGDAEAAAIDERGARERADRQAAERAAIASERGAAVDRALGDVTTRSRREVLMARAAMLERVRAAVAAELPALVARDPQLGRALVAAALACAGTAGTLRCAPALADLARAEAVAMRVEPDPAVATGVIIELAGGTSIDATLDGLLARAWPALACRVLELERAR